MAPGFHRSLATLLTAIILHAAEAVRPEFTDTLQNLTVPIGRDAVFTCQVRHLGGYRVGWVKADTKAIQAIHTHVITHNPRVRVSHRDQTTWNLHINTVQEEDRGTYMCQINYSPMMSQYGHLRVVVPPDIVSELSSGDLTIPEGGSAQLRCSARGYPKPTIQWRREDGRPLSVLRTDAAGHTQTARVTMFEGEVLPMLKVRRSDTGYYLCIASNGLPPSVMKKIRVEVHFHPVVQVQNQLHGVPLGTDVTLRCHVEALPKSINYWSKRPDEMLLPSTKYNISEQKDLVYSLWMTLTIRDFEVQDAGEYLCTAKNSIGEVQSEIRVYEIRLSPQSDGEPLQTEPASLGSGDSEDDLLVTARAPGTDQLGVGVGDIPPAAGYSPAEDHRTGPAAGGVTGATGCACGGPSALAAGLMLVLLTGL